MEVKDKDERLDDGINYNMRCIEILRCASPDLYPRKINYNMRCIEIAQKGLVRHQQTDKLQHEMY